MNDLALAALSFVGLLAYVSVAVAIYQWRAREITERDLSFTGWECVGLAVGVIVAYGSVLAALTLWTAHWHMVGEGVPWPVMTWGIGFGALWIFGPIAATALDYTGAFWDAAFAALWPAVFLAQGVTYALVTVIVAIASVPLWMGKRLASIPDRRARNRAIAESEKAARLDRIAELEKELL